jgi:hypothetical protein
MSVLWPEKGIVVRVRSLRIWVQSGVGSSQLRTPKS